MRPFLASLCALGLCLFSSASHAGRLSLEAVFGSHSLSGASPRNLQLSPDGTRVTYLRGQDADQFLLDLWEYNLAEQRHHLLVQARLLKAEEALSAAEQARRERTRSASLKGILEYSWAPDGKKLLVPLAGDLFLVDLAQPDTPRKIASGAVLDAKISPRGRYVSYLREQNLYVFDLQRNQERALTQDGGATLHNGEAEFVAQEEMGQTTGYWWAPDDSAIAFKHFDEAPVPLARRFEIYAGHTDVVEQRYPYAGQANVRVGLAVVHIENGQRSEIPLGDNPDIYLVRADWAGSSQRLTYQRESRDQKRLDLIAVDWPSGQHTLLRSETARTWVNLPDPPRFLAHGQGFLWTTEQNGVKQLARFDREGKLLYALTGTDWRIDGLLAVDEAAGLAYVSGNREFAPDKQIYAVHLDGRDVHAPLPISRAEGWHDAHFSSNGHTYIDSFSDPDHPPSVGLYRADGTRLAWLEENRLDAQHPYSAFLDAHVPTEFGTLKAEDGQTLHYALKKPLGFDPKRRYPVVIIVYGGPGAQTVQRRWGNLFDQYLAQQGYVVFRLDNRGSARRERAFTDVIYRELGRHEVQDQLTGLSWLAQAPYVDAARIGVFGWSYGGFMSLRLLCAASDRLAAGVSVAPVTDWALYDTHYVEQFIEQPQNNAEGYRNSGVFAHLDGLHAPLLLVHGMADDNVLFTHSTRLIDALSERGTVFDMMAYPGAKHGISGPKKQVHVYRTLTEFLARTLHPTPQPAPSSP